MVIMATTHGMALGQAIAMARNHQNNIFFISQRNIESVMHHMFNTQHTETGEHDSVMK